MGTIAPADRIREVSQHARCPARRPTAHAGLDGEGGHVRFTLTSDAGLNDGLAFTFTNAAIAAAGGAGTGDWIGR